MPDNFVANPGSGGSTFAADDVGGVLYPISKIDIGGDGVSSPVTAGNPLPVSGTFWPTTQPVSGSVSPTGAPVAYWPTYGSPTATGDLGVAIDSGGALVTRGAILTDEGTFRANFANASLAVSIGTVTVSGAIVTGTGFATTDVHLKDYFKLDADGESAWVQIDSIDSNTQLTLVASYVGGASGAASRALLQPITGAGGSISVASGQCVMTSGTTSGSRTIISRNVDYGPLVFRERVSVSQRVANQNLRIGLAEASATPRWFARFRLTGTDAATVVTCESGRNPTGAPSASETETSQITIPGGLTTAAMLDYRIEQLTESVRFYINNILVAENSKSLPSAYDFMNAGTLIENTATPASSTTVTVDYVTVKNHNKLEMGVMSDAEKIVASAAPLQQFSYSVAGVIVINTDLMVLDCSQLRSLFIQCNSMGTTGVVTVQWANDAAFTAPITATLVSETGATSTTFNAAVLRATNVMARYCRLRLTTATTGGTTTINVWGAQTTYTPIITSQTVNGSVSVGSIGASTSLIGDVGQQYRANATGAASGTHIISAATTNATIVKASAGRVLRWQFGNTSAVWQYVKLHNQTTLPTAGTGVVRTIAIPPGGRADGGLEGGVALATGIGLTIVTGSADADATATTLGAVVGDLFFA